MKTPRSAAEFSDRLTTICRSAVSGTDHRRAMIGRPEDRRPANDDAALGQLAACDVTDRRVRWGRASYRPFLFVLSLSALLSACGNSDDGDTSQKINGSVHVAAGKAPGPAATVNGSVTIDDGAAVTTANAVNGSVRLGAHATADELTTVNGSVTVGAGAHVAKQVESVNGGITLSEGADVAGTVGNVNGRIELTAAHVAGGIKTVNGGIKIYGASHVEGGIVVEKTSGQLIHFGNDVPRIEIGPGATVQGNLRFEREVKLYVSDRATIGPVTGATAIPFSGDTPPSQ